MKKFIQNNNATLNLESRMKLYEGVWHEQYLMPRTPAIIRVDGRAFHAALKRAKKPFDSTFISRMNTVAKDLLIEIQNSRFAYIQSDEISILLIDYNRFDSQQWFGGNREKMVSISASIASASFSVQTHKQHHFDSRVFNIPAPEVVNYFIWRQQDAVRNSIQMVAQYFYSHKQLLNKNTNEQQEMIFNKGQNWNDYPTAWKRGRAATKDGIDDEIPIFSRDRQYIEKFMEIEEG